MAFRYLWASMVALRVLWNLTGEEVLGLFLGGCWLFGITSHGESLDGEISWLGDLSMT